MRSLQKNLLQLMFDKIYYVNVDKHIERNDNFRSRFPEEYLTSGYVERINAIKPGNTDNFLHEDNVFLLEKIALNVQNGVRDHWAHKMQRIEMRMDHLYELCCSLSHAKLLEKAVAEYIKSDDSEHRILVLEDDSYIMNNKISYDDMVGIIYEDYDICYVGSTLFHNDLSGWLTEREYHIDCSVGESANHLWNANSGFFGTFGYVVKINASNINKIQSLIETLKSGVIADFCLSSQHYLIKKTVKNFFVDTMSNEKSTINESYDDTMRNCINPDLRKLDLVHGLQSNSGMKKPNFSIFMNRHKNAKQTWVFYKDHYHTTFKSQVFTEETESYDLLINVLSSNKAIETAYVVRYNDLSKPWRGIKTYIIKDHKVL